MRVLEAVVHDDLDDGDDDGEDDDEAEDEAHAQVVLGALAHAALLLVLVLLLPRNGRLCLGGGAGGVLVGLRG